MPNFSGFILLCAILPAVATAQGPGSDSLAAVLDRVRQGDVLRLAIEGERLSGTFHRLAGWTTLLHARTERVIPLVAVDTIWRRDSHAGLYATIGAASGAIAGGAMMWVLVYGPGGRSDEIIPAMAVGAAGGGLVGMSVGGLAGSFHPKWTMVFRP